MSRLIGAARGRIANKNRNTAFAPSSRTVLSQHRLPKTIWHCVPNASCAPGNAHCDPATAMRCASSIDFVACVRGEMARQKCRLSRNSAINDARFIDKAEI